MKADDDLVLEGENTGVTHFEYIQAKVLAQQYAIEQIQKILQYYNATITEKKGADINIEDKTWSIIQENEEG